MQYTRLLYEVKDSVARITLNRPEAGNAMDPELLGELMEVAIRCSEDPAVRAVLLTGTGKQFCAGGDLKSFLSHGSDLPAMIKRETTHLHAAISRFTRMNAPLITAVNGPAAGAGFSLVLASDLVVAGTSTFFSMAYTRLGLTPDGSATYFLPRIVGMRRAIELTFTNRRLSAPEALEWGIVNTLVPDAEVLGTATALAKEMAQGPTLAYGRAKKLLYFSGSESLETQMENESQSLADSTKTQDAKEGLTAFVAKRVPHFTGN